MSDAPSTRRSSAPSGSAGWAIGLLGGAVIALAAVLGLRHLWVPDSSNRVDPATLAKPVKHRGPLWPEEQRIVNLYEQVRPAVVRIEAAGENGQSASGFVWDRKGYVVSNAHALHGVKEVSVILDDNTRIVANVQGIDSDCHVAVLKLKDVDEKLLHPIDAGRSSDLKVGQFVFAIGQPHLTVGIISGLLKKEVAPDAKRTAVGNMILFKPAIDPSYLGGPVFDSAGRLVGMATATPAGGSPAIGFAVPVDVIQTVVPKLIAERTAEAPKPE